MKFIVLAVKGIKESLRDKKNFAFLMLFPLMFLVLFRVAFGWGPNVIEAAAKGAGGVTRRLALGAVAAQRLADRNGGKITATVMVKAYRQLMPA